MMKATAVFLVVFVLGAFVGSVITLAGAILTTKNDPEWWSTYVAQCVEKWAR